MKHNEVEKLNEIKYLLKTNQISYEKAKEKSKPYFVELNKKMVLIAKKFNKTHHQVSFISFMR